MYSRPVATAAAGWLAFQGAELIWKHYRDAGVDWFFQYGRKVALAEARQWMKRGQSGQHLLPLVREIAEGDTGALFVLGAQVGGATEDESRGVLELGVAYHWLDDTQAILKRGVFGRRLIDPDERDGICTLVTAYNGDANVALKYVRKMIRGECRNNRA